MSKENEQLFEVVTTIVDNNLKDLNYNITKVCVVIDDSEAKQGKYKVQSGLLKLDVVDDNPTKLYKNGDTVRVTIPNGDYDQKLVIEGDGEAGSYKKTIYNKVSNHFVPMTNNLLSNKPVEELDEYKNLSKKLIEIQQKKAGIIVTDQTSDELEEELDQIFVSLQQLKHTYTPNHFDFSSQEFEDEKTILTIAMQNRADSLNIINNDNLYNSIYLKFNYSFENFNIVQGEYRLNIKIYYTNNNDIIEKEYFIASSEFLGNPFSNLKLGQEALLVFSDLKNIEKITISGTVTQPFFQQDNEELTELPNNKVFIDNMIFQLGHEYVGQSGILLYSNDELTYSQNDFEKSLKYIWYRSDSNNNFLGFSEGYVKEDLYDFYKNFNSDNEAFQFENILLNDATNKEYPRDESGLSLVMEMSQMNKSITELDELGQKILLTMDNLKNEFKYFYDYDTNKKYADYKNINTKKIHYWYDHATGLSQLLRWWTDYWKDSALRESPPSYIHSGKNFFDLLSSWKNEPDNFDWNYMEARIWVPMIDNSLRDLIRYDKQAKHQMDIVLRADLWMYNGYYNQPGQKNQATQYLPGQFLYNYWKTDDAQKNNLVRCDAGVMIKAYKHKIAQLKRYYIAWKQGKSYGDASYTSTATRNELWNTLNISSSYKSITITLENLCNIIDDYIKLHNNLVTLCNDFENKLNATDTHAWNNADRFFSELTKALNLFQTKFDVYLKAIVQKQNNSTIDISTQANELSEVYDTCQIKIQDIITHIQNNIDTINILSKDNLYEKLAADIILNTGTGGESALDGYCVTLKILYDQYANSILNNLNLFRSKLDEINSKIKENYTTIKDYSLKNKTELVDWVNKNPIPDNAFGVYLLHFNPFDETQNIFTKEQGWEIVDNFVDSQEEAEKMLKLLPNFKYTFNKNRFDSVKKDSIILDFSSYNTLAENVYKFIIVEKGSTQYNIIQSNQLSFINLNNPNLFSAIPQIQLQKLNTKTHGINPVTTSEKIQYKIKVFDEFDHTQQKILYENPGGNSTQYPHLNSFRACVYPTNEKVFFSATISGLNTTNLVLNIASAHLGNTNASKEKIGIIELSILYNSGQSYTTYIPVIATTNPYCNLIGPKFLFFDNRGKYYFDTEQSYDIIGDGLGVDNIRYEIKLIDKLTNKIQENSSLMYFDHETNKIIVNTSYEQISKFQPILCVSFETYATLYEHLYCPILCFQSDTISNQYQSATITDILNNSSGGVYFSDIVTEIIEDNEEEIPVTFNLRSRNVVKDTQSLQEIEKGSAKMLSYYPYFGFSCNSDGKKIQIAPEATSPISLKTFEQGVDILYDGIKFSKNNFEPIYITYDNLTNGELEIQIQSIGVIQSDEIISTCNSE